MPSGVAAFSFIPSLLELLAPDRCPGCDLAFDAEQHAFCDACLPLLESTEVWSDGAHSAPSAAFLYGGPLAEALQRFKYAGRSELARPLGAMLASCALAYAGRVDCVAPVPLHPARLRSRGFNQSALLARPVARALGVPLAARALRRVRPTLDQAGLAREDRGQNVRGAFGADRRAPGARVLLIDDVRTTGATLAEAADALLRGGCERVHPLALARAGS